MTAETKTKAAPRLRFREFNDQWDQTSLKDILEVVIDNRGKTPPVKNEGIYLIEANALGDKLVDYSVIKKNVDIETYRTWFRQHLQKGDVLFTTVGATGLCSYYDGDKVATIAQNIVGLRANTQNSKEFLYYLLTHDANNHKFKAIEMIAVQPSVKVSQMIHLNFSLPNKKEQEKIAGFLGAVDEKIGVLQKKVYLLQAYKIGIMQALFTQKLRFKSDSGKTYPIWQEKKLGDLFDISSSKRVYESEWRDYGVPFYRTREILNLINNTAIKNPLHITEELFQKYTSQYGTIKKGDMLVTGVGTIGKMYLVNGDHKFYFKDGNVIWLKGNPNYDSRFVYYSFQTRLIKKQIEDNASITTVGTYTIQDAKKTKIEIPSLPEQQKIADFLTFLDDKINLTKKELEQAKTFKKALLQQMFV